MGRAQGPRGGSEVLGLCALNNSDCFNWVNILPVQKSKLNRELNIDQFLFSLCLCL